MERALPSTERALPLTERALPLTERALPLLDRALPLMSSTLPERRMGHVVLIVLNQRLRGARLLNEKHAGLLNKKAGRDISSKL